METRRVPRDRDRGDAPKRTTELGDGQGSRRYDHVFRVQRAAGNRIATRLFGTRGVAVPAATGTALPEPLKAGLEDMSGLSLDAVSVHHNSSRPGEMGAFAFTRGTDIYLGPGQERHLGHEAWHVVQQLQGRVAEQARAGGLPVNEDTRLEREADVMGTRAMNAPVRPRREVPVPLPKTSSSGPVQMMKIPLWNFLEGIHDFGKDDPEWDPQWTAALERVAADQQFQTVMFMKVDDSGDGEDAVRILQGLATLSSTKPNIFRLAIDAVRWAEGTESTSGGSGFGSLDVSGTPFAGRPAFPKSTLITVPVKSGQHRRHVLAWHTIRQFVELAAKAFPHEAREVIEFKLSHPDNSSVVAVAEAAEHVNKSRATVGPFTDEEKLKMALFVMNGNPRNLWAGRGKTNSAINTAASHMKTDLAKPQTFKELGTLIESWKTKQGKAVYTTATGLGASVLYHAAHEAHERFVTTPGAKEADFVRQAVDQVDRYLISNLEIDVLGDTKAQNQLALEKEAGLHDAIALIDNVVRGAAPVNFVPPGLIRLAIEEFMTYQK